MSIDKKFLNLFTKVTEKAARVLRQSSGARACGGSQEAVWNWSLCGGCGNA